MTPAYRMMKLTACCLLITLMTIDTDANMNKSWPPPPPWTEKAKMARYLAHYADWGVVSAISPDFGFVPFGTLQSISDGPVNKSTGIHYFYMSSLSDTYHNIAYNNSVSLFITHDESNYCQTKQLDPEEPLCARLTLVGKIVPVTNEIERDFAKMSLFSRHPAMKHWPASHGWKFFKLTITGIYLLDYYGGATHLSVQDYFNAKP